MTIKFHFSDHIIFGKYATNIPSKKNLHRGLLTDKRKTFTRFTKGRVVDTKLSVAVRKPGIYVQIMVKNGFIFMRIRDSNYIFDL
jgi:hypothetical protein